MAGVVLELCEHFLSSNWLTETGDEERIQEHRRARIAQTSDAVFLLPERRLKMLPIQLIGTLSISALFEKFLKHKVLDQISGTELSAT